MSIGIAWVYADRSLRLFFAANPVPVILTLDVCQHHVSFCKRSVNDNGLLGQTPSGFIGLSNRVAAPRPGRKRVGPSQPGIGGRVMRIFFNCPLKPLARLPYVLSIPLVVVIPALKICLIRFG